MQQKLNCNGITNVISSDFRKRIYTSEHVGGALLAMTRRLMLVCNGWSAPLTNLIQQFYLVILIQYLI